MSNAQVTDVKKIIPLDEVAKLQGSDEGQFITVTLQDEEEIEKTGTAPTLH